MNDERQEWISKRAYDLWEAEGKPQGKDLEHWERAARERAELERTSLPTKAAKHKPNGFGSAAADTPKRQPPARKSSKRPSTRH